MEELEEKEENEAFVEDQLQAISNAAYKATTKYLLTDPQILQTGEASNSNLDKEEVRPFAEEEKSLEDKRPSFQLGVLLQETLVENEDVHSKRQLFEGDEMSPAHKIQRTGDENERVFKKKGRKSSSFRFDHGSPAEVNFTTHPNSAFQLVDPAIFIEPPPGFESFKKYTRSTRRIQLAKVQGRVSVAVTQQSKEKEKANEGDKIVAHCNGMKGRTTLTIEG